MEDGFSGEYGKTFVIQKVRVALASDLHVFNTDGIGKTSMEEASTTFVRVKSNKNFVRNQDKVQTIKTTT